jgi:hypothetical protein
MRVRFFKALGVCSSLLVVFAFAARLQAQSQDNKAIELNNLRLAYGTLCKADHDYKGHRVRAMHAIEAACDILGTDIRGDGKSKEGQSISDAELRQAQTLVQQALGMAQQQNQKKVAAHLTKAINEISIALTIK